MIDVFGDPTLSLMLGVAARLSGLILLGVFLMARRAAQGPTPQPPRA